MLHDFSAADASFDLKTEFASRHIGPNAHEIEKMLVTLGVRNLDELLASIVPPGIRYDDILNIPAAVSEEVALQKLAEILASNRVQRSFIGMGYFESHLPGIIRRNVLENPAWYTSYTPYQAEIAQGRLEAMLNFQTLVTDLTGMEVANASLLDEGTAAAEAMGMAFALRKKETIRRFVVSETCHPQTKAVLLTRARPLGIEIEFFAPGNLPDGETFGGIFQYPATDGALIDPTQFITAIQSGGGLAILGTDPLALVLLRSPGEWGADIAVGSAQRFGIPLGGGGPHAAYFATREAFKRQIPGRLVGVSRDAHGNSAFRLSLQTREQHIRREKATSNICTAQVLLAVMASMYAVYHGPNGLRRIAERVHNMAETFSNLLSQAGLSLGEHPFFDTVRIHGSPKECALWMKEAREAGCNIRQLDEVTLTAAFDEVKTSDDLARLAAVFVGEKPIGRIERAHSAIPEAWIRSTPILTHAVFNTHHSETAMLRYIRRLEARDLSLCHSMIPLGSCTMKLNAASEMFPLSWPAVGRIHPFAPTEQQQGYREMANELEEWLAEITGLPAVSLQPNAGSQGEYAGLLAIRGYHQARGQGGRDLCLIPTSAHGTNPASAVMAGYKVIPVSCDQDGNISLEDLKTKLATHRSRVAAIMVTYPSTHGVFEGTIRDICDLVHEEGGQVYLDGANMNALVGLCRPGDFGVDVCHLNLHKTFCIPHGGGGPGVGPIAAAKHLQPHLPGNPLELESGAVASAPYGSASILTISWMYIRMMGAHGLRLASAVAILNANYVAARLKPHYPILYTGPGGWVAHECIIDLRTFKQTAGIEVDDVAKRLMDYGFHAPTMSWPVLGTMMIEPTESENLAELDRFCEALIAIRREIAEVECGSAPRERNLLKNAPHTASALLDDSTTMPYSREQAAFPLAWVRASKFWPPVGRIDNVHGDRNLMCTCPSVDEMVSA